MENSNPTLSDETSATEWQKKLPYQRLYAEMRDGIGIELFPSLPGFKWLKLQNSAEIDPNLAERILEFFRIERPDLIWEIIWHLTYIEDNSYFGGDLERYFKEYGNGEEDEYNTSSMFNEAIYFNIRKRFGIEKFSDANFIVQEMVNQIHSELIPILSVDLKKAPWIGPSPRLKKSGD